MAEKLKAFQEWLQERDTDVCDRYRARRAVVKQAVKVIKKMANCRCGERLRNDFEGNKNMFWKEVQRVRIGELAANGRDGKGCEWSNISGEYIQQVLNVEDVREANIKEVGDWPIPVF